MLQHNPLCRGKIRCAKCGGEHEYDKCTNKTELKCCNCGGQHSAPHGGCEKQKEAREVQKYKIMHQVSYSEAVKKVVKEKCNGPVHVTEQNIRRNPNKNTGFSDKKIIDIVENNSRQTNSNILSLNIKIRRNIFGK